MGDEEVSKLRRELAQMKKSAELLQASNLDQRDEIRALRSQARSYEEAISSHQKKVQMLVGLLKNAERSYEEEITALAQKVQMLGERRTEARSYEEKITALTQKVQTLEEGKKEARSFEEEIIALTQKVQLLEGGTNRARSSEEEIAKLTQKVQMLEEVAEQGTPARNIGREVRLRYLEKYRRGKGRTIGPVGHARIKTGDRAAHRGRPVVDALLCLTGEIEDRKVYPDLYGVSPEMMKNWKDVPEMVEVTSFRASLQTERRLTADFQEPFERLIELATEFKSSPELISAFAEKQVLQQLHLKVQDCYDKIVAANPWIKTPTIDDNCGSGSGRLQP